MGSYGPKNISGGTSDTKRVSLAPKGIKHMPVDWTTVPSDQERDKCLPLGTILIPITAEGKRTGFVGSYDSSASDGRQLVSRSNAFILNATVYESDQEQSVEMFELGDAYKPYLRVGGENQPTWEEFEMAFTQFEVSIRLAKVNECFCPYCAGCL